MTSQIICVKSNIANGDLCLMRMVGRVSLSESVSLQHVQHGGLASIVQSEEDDAG